MLSNPYPARRPAARPHRRARGFTLIEVLVALLVLSIGLLGFAGLQAASLRFNHSAYMRTQATNLAYDIADRMRANRQAALGGDYDIGYTDFPAPDAGSTEPIAAQDLDQWSELVEGNLTQGEGEIVVGTGCNNCLTVRLRWLDDRETGDTVEYEYNTRI